MRAITERDPRAELCGGKAEQRFKACHSDKDRKDDRETLRPLIGQNAVNNRLHRKGANEREKAENDRERNRLGKTR